MAPGATASAPLAVTGSHLGKRGGTDSNIAAAVPAAAQAKRQKTTMTPAEKTLGELARRSAERLANLGWEGLVTEARGRTQMADGVRAVPHKAARLLDYLRRKGASVVMHTSPWTVAQVQHAALRGSHKSARDHTEFVCEELLEFCAQGYWLVLPFTAVQHLTKLRLSPLGVVPQRDRRPRLIVDYTFSNVNQETVRLAPPESMQFGRALQRLVTSLVHSDPKYGPPYLAKIDIADGFYRVWIRSADVPTLGVVLPHSDNAGSILVAFPLALPMGWVESPPFFTTLTETVCDLTNRAMSSYEQLPEHRLEAASRTPPAVPSTVSAPRTPWARDNTQFVHDDARSLPLARADVYVDDFLLAAQTKRMQSRLLRQALTSIDHVLRPVEATDPVYRKEPTSVKKLLQGDAAWSTQKRMLGWDIDTVRGTLSLPPHRSDRLRAILDQVQPPRKRLRTSEWHQILGELRSMSAALPGSRGLFSVLQATLSKGDKHRVRLNRHVFDVISDFRLLVDSVAQRPTRLRELVPVSPSDTGACDACRVGMGGVWFDALDPMAHPLVWRAEFPAHIQLSLITAECPRGTLSISDLELAGIIAHKDILAQARHVHERTLWVAGDNRASVSWATKGSSTSTAARAYLLRLDALHQRAHRYVARHHYLPGTLNRMADDASRLWHLSDAALLTHFNSHYPQTVCWELRHLAPQMGSSLIGALSRQRCTPASLRSATVPFTPHGASGRNFVSGSASTPHSPQSPATRYLFSNSSPIGTATAASPAAHTRSVLAQWRTPSEAWGRRSPGWGPRTLA